MHKRYIIGSVIFFYLVGIFSLPCAASVKPKTGDMQFIQNAGQWQSNIVFAADVAGGRVFLEKNCFTWNFTNSASLSDHAHDANTSSEEKIFKSHAFKTTFLGSNTSSVTGENMFSNYYNYFIGSDKSLWRGKVHAFGAVRYNNLYTGIDLVAYSADNAFKYDFEIAPGASAESIHIEYTGLDQISIADHNLQLHTSLNTVVEMRPYAYQTINNHIQAVPCEFVLSGNIVSYYFPAGYDTRYPLTIDPATLIFSSFSGSTSDNWGYTATYDDAGNLYGGGIVNGTGYPIVLGAYQSTFGGGTGYACDIAISKFTADGTDLIYSTYLGGSGEDLPFSLVVDSANELIVYGATSSSNFPVSATAFDQSFNGGTSITVDVVLDFITGSDVFITKFDADATDIVGSTYMGGGDNDGLNIGTTLTNYGDHSRGDVAVDIFGNCYIASCTYSGDLPVTAGVFQASKASGQDGFIAKFNSDLSALVWCSFFGGNGDEGVYSIKKMQDDNFIVCGGTSSTNLPTTAGALNTTFNGGTLDGWVARINSDASAIVNCTYIGTSAYDQTYVSEVDDYNDVYIAGQTSGAYPVTAGVYSNPGSSQYITKLSPDLSSIIYSTVFGSGSSTVNIDLTALLVDKCQHVYVAGWGGNVNHTYYPLTGYTTGLPVTADAFQSTTDGSDFYFIVFDKDATGLLYATFFGGASSQEHVDGGTSRFDKKGRIYEAICAGCGGHDDMPTTPGAWSNTNNSSNCNLGVVKFQFDFPETQALFDATPLTGCSPLNVSFTNNSNQANYYAWTFGDGTSSADDEPTHLYTEVGSYTATLIASDSFTCNLTDTSTVLIQVFGYPTANFTPSKNPVSIYDSTQFLDLSTGAVSWLWDFGDGSTSEQQNPYHQYAVSGTYTVCLTTSNEHGCEDSICFPIDVFENSLLDIPNAFSPNGDGVNDIYFPVNFGLKEYYFRIYNRWGQLVFETHDPKQGWNGIFNSKEQDMDVYVFVIDGIGKDNVPYHRQGNVTLVR